MTGAEIYTRLKKLNIPVAYSHFPEPTPAPFVVFLIPSTNRYGSDFKNYIENHTVRIELYTEYRDESLTEMIFQLFDGYEISYEEIYIEEEKVMMSTFEFQETVKTGGQ